MNSYYTFVSTLTQKYRFMSIMSLSILALGLLSGVILVQKNQIMDRSALTGGPVVFLDPVNKTVGSGSVGNTYDVYVSTKGYDVTGVKLSLSYDSRYIIPVSFDVSGPFVDLCAASPYCDMNLSGGVIDLNLGTGLTSFSGEAKLGTIRFNTSVANASTTFAFTSGTVLTALRQVENALGGTTNGNVCIGECGGVTATAIPVTDIPAPTGRNRPGPRTSPTSTPTVILTNTPTPRLTSTPTPTITNVPTVTNVPSVTNIIPNISSVPTPIISIVPPSIESPTVSCRFKIFGLCLWR